MKPLELASPGPLRDKLVQSVLDDKKIATTSRLEEWKAEGEPFPVIGER